MLRKDADQRVAQLEAAAVAAKADLEVAQVCIRRARFLTGCCLLLLSVFSWCGQLLHGEHAGKQHTSTTG